MANIPPLNVTLFGGPKQRANYQLTALGKTKAEQVNISGTRGEVIMVLENIGPCTLSELSSETKMSPVQVKQMVQVLIRDGWAMKVRTGE